VICLNNERKTQVVTGDESWLFAYYPETKMQSSEWHTSSSSRPKKSRETKSNIKVMLVTLFDDEGIVHREFVPTGTSVTAAFYVDVLTRLRKVLGENGLRNGRTTGLCIMITRPVTWLWQFSRSCPKIKFRLRHTRPIPQTSHQVTSGSSLAENGPSRTSFRNGGRHERKCRHETVRDEKKDFNQCHNWIDRWNKYVCVCVCAD
jgi:hypothetical protein